MTAAKPLLRLPDLPMKSADMSDSLLLKTIRFPVYASRKYDGVRIIFYRGSAYSASGRLHRNPSVQQFAAYHKHALHEQEGELWHPNLEAAQVAGWCNRKESNGPAKDGLVFEDNPLRLAIFGGYSKTLDAFYEMPVLERDGVTYAYHQLIHDRAALLRKIELAKSQGHEGLMLRGGDLSYKHGRSTPLEQFSMKIVFDTEALARCIGFEYVQRNNNAIEDTPYGTTERASKKADRNEDTSEVGSFTWAMLNGDYKGVEFSARGSFTKEQMQTYATYPPLGKEAEIRYKPGGKDKPRQPRFKRWQGEE